MSILNNEIALFVIDHSASFNANPEDCIVGTLINSSQ